MQSYQDHQIIDYNHKYMFDGKWYKRNLGTPTNIWQSTKSNTYTDRFDIERTAPPGTWWQTTKVTDPEAIQLIDDEKLNAYSLTTVNKQFLQKFLQLTQGSVSTKNKETLEDLHREYGISTKYRTPISKIKEPVAFTVSLTDFPCVGGAVFAKDCLLKSQGRISTKSTKEEDDIMTEETNKTNGGWSMNDVKELFGLFTSIKADNEEKAEPETEKPEPEQEQEYVTREELNTTLEENNKKLIGEIKDIIDEKIKPEEKEEPAKEESEAEEEGNISNKNTEETPEPSIGEEPMPQEEPVPQSQQLDDPTPQEEEEAISYKKGTPEYKILQNLGRDALGNTKIRL